MRGMEEEKEFKHPWDLAPGACALPIENKNGCTSALQQLPKAMQLRLKEALHPSIYILPGLVQKDAIIRLELVKFLKVNLLPGC